MFLSLAVFLSLSTSPFLLESLSFYRCISSTIPGMFIHLRPSAHARVCIAQREQAQEAQRWKLRADKEFARFVLREFVWIRTSILWCTRACVCRGEFTAAVSSYTQSLKLLPDQPFAFASRAEARFELKDFDEVGASCLSLFTHRDTPRSPFRLPFTRDVGTCEYPLQAQLLLPDTTTRTAHICPFLQNVIGLSTVVISCVLSTTGPPRLRPHGSVDWPRESWCSHAA